MTGMDERLAKVAEVAWRETRPRPMCRDCADMRTDRCQDDPNGRLCDPKAALQEALAPLLVQWQAEVRAEALREFADWLA